MPRPLERRGRSFRAQLVLFAALVVSVVLVPVLLVEVPRPWQALDELIARGETLLAGVETTIPEADLVRMNAFALAAAALPPVADDEHLAWAFSLLLERGALPAEAEMRRTLRERMPEDAGRLDYPTAVRALEFWRQRFAADPALIPVWQQARLRLGRAMANAARAGLAVSNTYVMVDDGKTFAFLVDGSAWYGGTYPGQRYDTAAHGDDYWRAYLTEGPGFGHNPTHHALGIFPKFDTDRWGTWFTTWLSVRRGGAYDVFSIDLEASLVQRLMWTVGGCILALLALVVTLIALLTRRLSREISAPVLRLCEGTEAVIRGDYTHVVPGGGSRELARLIEVFNKMTLGLAERLNLMQSLEKLLSRELAEQVAQHGLVLGGKKVEITNLFTDFACFSTISRSLSPEAVVTMLNDYFAELVPLIKSHGGLPDKYIGDAIVAIFGAPVPLENHAGQALACAIAMQRRVRGLNERRRAEGKPVLEMRIGLNSGDVIAGAIGSDLKLEYTTIGETTNLANRMETLCAIGQVLVSEHTFQRIRDLSFPGVKIAATPQLAAVKGYDRPLPVHPVCIDELRIEKNPCPTGPEDCYRYDRCA